jgi:hypothetical protein
MCTSSFQDRASEAELVLLWEGEHRSYSASMPPACRDESESDGVSLTLCLLDALELVDEVRLEDGEGSRVIVDMAIRGTKDSRRYTGLLGSMLD